MQLNWLHMYTHLFSICLGQVYMYCYVSITGKPSYICSRNCKKITHKFLSIVHESFSHGCIHVHNICICSYIVCILFHSALQLDSGSWVLVGLRCDVQQDMAGSQDLHKQAATENGELILYLSLHNVVYRHMLICKLLCKYIDIQIRTFLFLFILFFRHKHNKIIIIYKQLVDIWKFHWYK